MSHLYLHLSVFFFFCHLLLYIECATPKAVYFPEQALFEFSQAKLETFSPFARHRPVSWLHFCRLNAECMSLLFLVSWCRMLYVLRMPSSSIAFFKIKTRLLWNVDRCHFVQCVAILWEQFDVSIPTQHEISLTYPLPLCMLSHIQSRSPETWTIVLNFCTFYYIRIRAIFQDVNAFSTCDNSVWVWGEWANIGMSVNFVLWYRVTRAAVAKLVVEFCNILPNYDKFEISFAQCFHWKKLKARYCKFIISLSMDCTSNWVKHASHSNVCPWLRSVSSNATASAVDRVHFSGNL